MSYNNNSPNPYYHNYNNNESNYSTNSINSTSPTSPTSPYTNMNGSYYNHQGSPTIVSTSNYSPGNRRVQDLGQRSLTNVHAGNNSTGSLSGATAVGIPPVELTRNADDVSSMDLHRPGVYNQTNDAMVLRQYTGDEADEDHQSSFPDPMSTKRESRTGLTSTPLMERNLDDTGGQHYNDYNQSSGYFSQYNNYYRQDDPYYDEGSSRHNTLTSKYPPYGNENDYTDRDFPGGGKNARQTMFGEDFGLPEKRRKRCCGCCSWTICLVITLIVLTALGITGFFVWPRIPKVDIKEGVPASQPNLSTNPPFIGMKINMTVEIDNRENYVPYKFNKIDVAVFDRAANTDKSIATGSKPDYTLQPKRIDTIEFPITVNYTAESINDPVIQDFIAACSPQSKTNTPLRLRVEVVLFVWGIDWIYKPKISVPIPDMKCPVPEL